MRMILMLFLLLFPVRSDSLPAKGLIRFAVILIGESKPGWEPGNIGLARKLCARAGLRCDIVPLSPQRSFTELNAGRVQFLIALENKPAGPEPIRIVKIGTTKIVVVGKRPFDNCEPLNGAHLAALHHTLYAQRLADRCPGMRLSLTNTYEQSLKMYRSGRVDGMIGVIMNFNNPSKFWIQPQDIVTEVDENELWLFGNSVTRDSEASFRLQAAVAQHHLQNSIGSRQ